MKTAFQLFLVSILLVGTLSFAQEQAPAVNHNTWTSGVPMPTGVFGPAVAALKNQIYAVGGYAASGDVADTQIYNPATNTWSTGVSLPTTIESASAAVVKNVLYVFGGYNSGALTNAVWAYNPKTKTWTGKAAMPTARAFAGAVVLKKKNIIYVIGGYNGTNFLATVESYNPATDTWTEEAPTLVTKGQLAVGLIGTTILASDGAIAPGVITGDTEGYDATTNTWTTLAADPTARVGSCYGSVGPNLFDAGGYLNNAGTATNVNESFKLSKNKWTTALAPMPQATMFGGSVAYKGQLYCFGGWATYLGAVINNVQIYQP